MLRGHDGIHQEVDISGVLGGPLVRRDLRELRLGAVEGVV